MAVAHGEPEAGKTAVVQALYETVATRAAARAAPEPLVWPATLAPPDVNDRRDARP